MNAAPPLTIVRDARPAGHPTVASGRIGVLLVNLGTPEATDYWSMRRYLHEFLSDRRVIETPRWLWTLVLNVGILTTRPRAKGRDYDAIWNKERNEVAAEDLHAVPKRKACGRASRFAHRSRLGDALRQAADPRAS